MMPPRFWQQPNTTLPAIALQAFSPLWVLAARMRAHFANPYSSRLPVICVGNVTLGGAGKTPTAIALLKAFKVDNPCFLTRGYLGQTRVATHVASPDAGIYGDEAVLLSRHAPTIVSPNRVEGLRLAETTGHDLVIADDGFQNPTFAKNASLLVIDGGAGIGNGRVIPAGPLREPLNDALKRAKAVLIIGDDKNNVAKRITVPVFRGVMKPVNPQPSGKKYVAFAGIGRPEKFFATLREAQYNVIETVSFADHHAYTEADRARLASLAARHEAQLITTEKDRVRLAQNMKDVETLGVELEIEDIDRLVALLQGAR